MEQSFTAEWAWIGKKPGSREDYGVLEASDRQIRVGEFIGKYVAGVPHSSTHDRTPTGPPWVTFGSHPTTTHRPLLSVLVQDDWNGQDEAGRPIWPQRFFLCWYDEAAGVGASYRALWDAVNPFTLPRRDRELVPIEIRPRPTDGTIAAIEAIGFKRAAAMAAALLASPVAVTGTADLYLSNPDARLDRLAVLDAVAALLPYGFRADLSTSSIVDNTVAHRMRLVLADYSNDSQQAAPLRAAPVVPRSDVARDYLEMLLDKTNPENLETVLAYLWEAADACSFSHPERAWEILYQLNRLDHAFQAVVTAPEGRKPSLVFFANAPAEVAQMWQSPTMTAPMQRKLVRPLLDSDRDDEGATEALRRNWDVVLDTVLMIDNRSLNEGDIARAVRSFGVADSLPQVESADRLLLKLVVPPREDLGQDWILGIKTRAVLLRQLRVPRPGDLGRTCLTLRSGQADSWQGHLIKELLYRGITDDPTEDRAAGWATWLSRSEIEGNPAEWVLGLGSVLGDPGGARNYDCVRALIQRDAVWAATLLRLARHAGQTRVALQVPGLAEDLVELAARVAAQAGQEDIRLALAIAVDVPLWDYELAPAIIAAVDVARLLLGYQPQDFPHDRSQQECDRYNEGLNHVLALPCLQKQENFVSRFLHEVTWNEVTR